MIQIFRIIGFAGTRSFRRNTFTGVKSLMRKHYERSTKPATFFLAFFPLRFITVNIDENDVEGTRKGTENQSFALKSVQNACNDSLNPILNLLNTVIDAISDSSFQCKAALNEVISLLEKYETAAESTDSLKELEDALIGARARVIDCKQTYLELITLTENIEKVIKAVSELSFLIRKEALALALSETLHSIRESIEINAVEMREIAKKICEFESRRAFSDAEISETRKKDFLAHYLDNE